MENLLIRVAELPDCPLCHHGGKEVHIAGMRDTLYHVPGEWTMARCLHCGLLYLSPAPLPEDIGKAYEEYYTHAEEKANILAFLRPLEQGYVDVKYGYARKSWKRCLQFLALSCFPTEKAEADTRYFYLDTHKVAKGKLLDVGCGSGEMMKRLRGKGWDVEGLDFDADAIEQCRKAGIEAKAGDLFSQEYPSGTFDVVTMNHVIEHLYGVDEVVKECFRILKPGGWLVMATPNSQSRQLKRFGRNWFCWHSPAHLQVFNRENLSFLCRESGFQINKSFTTCRNEHWVHACSCLIEKNGHFSFGAEKPGKKLLLKGKMQQLWTWFLLHFKKNIGIEVVVIARKPGNRGKLPR